MKKILWISLQGICIACTIFTIFGIIFDLSGIEGLSFGTGEFTKQAIGAIFIGIAFSAPSEIYNNEKLPFPLKFIFHMGIGCTVYLITAFKVGWISADFGWKNCLLLIAIELLVAFIIWLGFANHYKKLAKNMNKRIQEKNSENVKL